MRISAVSYLNTKPFIYGLFRSHLADSLDLTLDIPSECARKLLSGEADLALTPVAIIAELPQAHLISNYCIGSVGAVKTVCLYADQPLETIETIYLDYHSRSSVALTKLLCANYWHIQPTFVPATPGYQQKIGGKVAGLVIGDRTIGLDQKYKYVYDLGSAWTAWTGLPFVYAAWVSVKPLSVGFIEDFNAALQEGLDHLPELIKILPSIEGFDLVDYFQQNISYQLDDAKWEGLNLFLRHLSGERGYQLTRHSASVPILT